jgi:hypothetical protein
MFWCSLIQWGGDFFLEFFVKCLPVAGDASSSKRATRLFLSLQVILKMHPGITPCLMDCLNLSLSARVVPLTQVVGFNLYRGTCNVSIKNLSS